MKTSNIARKLRRFRAQICCSEPFQQGPVKQGPEIDVINDVGNKSSCITGIGDSLAEKMA